MDDHLNNEYDFDVRATTSTTKFFTKIHKLIFVGLSLMVSVVVSAQNLSSLTRSPTAIAHGVMIADRRPDHRVSILRIIVRPEDVIIVIF